MPVEFSVRKALLGSGYVLRFHNTGKSVLPIGITLINPTFHRMNRVALTIDPNRVKEIGHSEGWTAANGDMVIMQSNGFATERYVVDDEKFAPAPRK